MDLEEAAKRLEFQEIGSDDASRMFKIASRTMRRRISKKIY